MRRSAFSSIKLPALAKILSLGLFLCLPPVMAHDKPASPASKAGQSSKKKLDYSGKTQRGKASYYHDRFAGQTMADGTPMDPNSNVAASRTLPLGTKAKVTNLETGKSAVVEIRDRGPYVEGRIADVSPKVAEKLDMTEEGVVPVTVTPLELPGQSSAGGGSGGKAAGKE